ncbi:MAG TPA: DUF3488 and transglutaminase-like domain-containing protein [Thermodesulfovibrionales bacterium]|nr:DUF3488 and transglutaminase-like domain-containing protein [Thermodesulfovibrionales bacterium]
MKKAIKIEDAVKLLTCVISLAGFLSIVRYVGASYSMVFGSLFLFSLYFEYHRKFLLPRWLLTIAAFAIILVTSFRMTSDDPVVAAVEALLILLAIKLLAEKKFRDYMQIYAMALFLLTGSALLSLDMEFLLYFVSFIFLVTIALVLLTYLSQDSTMEIKVPALMKIISKCSLIPLIAIPATILMFIILPRTSYPLLTFLNRGTMANTGFTDTVQLGKVSDIQEDSSVILRAHMARVDENSLYWRGIVLDYFSGASWQRSQKEIPERSSAPRIPGKQIPQTIYLEPYGNSYLFALDKPASISLRRSFQHGDLTYSLHGNVVKRTRYYASSVLSDSLADDTVDASYLQLPQDRLENIHKLVKTLSSGKSREETLQTLVGFLTGGEFRYTMENMPVSDNPVEDFLFSRKYGNCEYFASALAVMSRIAGIPSRIVGGYKGGYYNDTGEYYLVPQKNAHVWVEAYLKNKGWVRLDPTPVGIENFVSTAKKDFIFKTRLFFDTMNYYWNAAIINYDFSKQLLLFHKIRSFKMPKINFSINKEHIAKHLPTAILVVFFVGAVFLLTRRKKAPEERILHFFLKEMGKHGYEKTRSEGLEEFAAKIGEDPLREKALAFIKEFERHYYRDTRIAKEDFRRLKALIKGRMVSKISG